MDADAGNHTRKIVAFVGGLDLCGGRYDTPRHTLFHTLQTFHKEDYYNPNFAVNILSHIYHPFVSTLCNCLNRFHPYCHGTVLLLEDLGLVAIR